MVGHFGAGNKKFHEDHDLCHDADDDDDGDDGDDDDADGDDDGDDDADDDDDDDNGEHVPGKETISVNPKHGCVVSVAEI